MSNVTHRDRHWYWLSAGSCSSIAFINKRLLKLLLHIHTKSKFVQVKSGNDINNREGMF